MSTSSPFISCRRLTVYTIAAVLLQIFGLSLFVFGFFPIKPALSGVSGPESFLRPSCETVEDTNERDLPPDKLRSLYQRSCIANYYGRFSIEDCITFFLSASCLILFPNIVDNTHLLKDLSGIPHSFDRLILMVIDGLPAEFVLGKSGEPPSEELVEAMPYTQFLLQSGIAAGYHAMAAPPTVTMPRLKAMVSGAIGGFLDVALNFNTQAFLDDNLLGQLLSTGCKMVMFGDETWLKLFPQFFIRHDGVSSFYVKDTVQVDYNVSRHLRDELNRDDWNILILHYLGLDHVGHVGGRNSVLMAPKLREMDDAIRMIHLSTFQTNQNDASHTLLIVVSDHGMTESGNHGGSTFEEADALALFIGSQSDLFDSMSATPGTAYQVDIAPTLAILLGVPIPKNSIGVLITGILTSLTDAEKLRALELNSWQLLRLLKAQLPGLSCKKFLCDGFTDKNGPGAVGRCSGSAESIFCCLYSKASFLHGSWKSTNVSREDFTHCVAAYNDFLRAASEWLSRKASDKPVILLSLGILAMLVATTLLSGLLLLLCREESFLVKRQLPVLNNRMCFGQSDEVIILAFILILVISMGSSSLVEEEQYIWNFMVSSLFLMLLRRTLQYFSFNKNSKSYFQISAISVLLISGRILRGWHQGGVNWTHLPDISKWLEDYDTASIQTIRILSGSLVMILSICSIYPVWRRRKFVTVLVILFLVAGSLVLHYIIKYQNHTAAASGHGATFTAQIIFVIIGSSTIGTLLVLPWFMAIEMSNNCSGCDVPSIPMIISNRDQCFLIGLQDCIYLMGWVYISFWCLLQILLQQAINSVPVSLLFVQLLAILFYYSAGSCHKQWVEIAVLYYLGMTGHFSLGNSNTLATIDVAGAFIGVSNYSTFLSGILMFMITYAAPIFFLLSMVMYTSFKDLRLASIKDSGSLLKMILPFPCLVPLGINSILLAAYTILLLQMRNHLFIWSVFSPKYLYVCATTACVYLGVLVFAATGTYTCCVFALWRRNKGPKN